MDPEKGPLSGQLNQFMQGLTVMGKARERGVAGGTPANMQAIRGEMQMMSAMKGMMGGKLFDASARPGETAEQTQQRVQSENGIETDLGGNLCIGFSFHIAENIPNSSKFGLLFNKSQIN